VSAPESKVVRLVEAEEQGQEVAAGCNAFGGSVGAASRVTEALSVFTFLDGATANSLGGADAELRVSACSSLTPGPATPYATETAGTARGFLMAPATTTPERSVSAATRCIAAPSPTRSATAPESRAPTA